MIPVYASSRVRALDEAVIRGRGVPGRVLMELAGRQVADQLQARWPSGPVAVLCGPGNNGGDGYVIARWLSLWGRPVRVWASGPPATEDARANAALAAELGLMVGGLDEALRGAAVAVDALLGTGQRSGPRGVILEAVRALAEAPAVLAVDLPTGLDGDTGQPLGEAVVRADLTVTLGAIKPGLLAEPGATLAGALALADIGLSLAVRHDPGLARPDAQIIEASDIQHWTIPVAPGAAKWDRGHVAVIAGGGAAVLAAHGALAAGAGLVSLLAPRAEWDRLRGLRPDVILAERDALRPERHDVIVLGPGLGTDPAAEALTRSLWTSFAGAMVVDADGLTALSREALPSPAGPRVLTPHAAEAARLLGTHRAAVEADRFGAAAHLGALVPGGAALLKGRNTLIASGGGLWVNPTGSARLATGGSGDVLSGMVGALLASGQPPVRAAAIAAWRHGLAGEQLEPYASASDLLPILRAGAGSAA